MVAPLPDPIVIAHQAGDVRIHTFISAYTGDNIANATHIVESENVLVLVDGQFLAPYARQFRAYADSLNKPIDRLYLSHRHPDHWFGLGYAFADVAIHALPETISFLEEHGEDSRQDHWKLGRLAPETVVIPTHSISPGEEHIDGIKYVFDCVVDTEIDFLLTIGLPDLGVFIAQDLLYSGTHLYLTQHMAHWIGVLQRLLLSDYDLFLAGHGVPAGKAEIAGNIEYLSAALAAVGEGLTGEAFKHFLLQRYPGRLCPGIFDIYLPRLFGSASDY